jgi:hypothetical protein
VCARFARALRPRIRRSPTQRRDDTHRRGGIDLAHVTGMNKKTPLRKLSLDTQTVRRLDPAQLAQAVGAAKANTSFMSVLMQCSWYCATASCFVDNTCGIQGCAMH